MLKPEGALWVIGSYHNIFRVGTILQDLGFWVLNDVVWRKTNPMPNFRGRRFTNAHETLVWVVDGTEGALHLQLRGDEGAERRAADALGLAVPDLLGPRAAQAGRRPQDASDAEAGGAAPPHHSRVEPTKAMSSSILSSAQAPRRRWPSGSAASFIGIEREQAYADAARARLEAVTPLKAASVEIVRGKRAEARIPFGALVEIGLISPGTVLYDARARHEAEVRADGSIASAGAQGSIHKIGAHVQGATACNGWTFWHYDANGTLKPIDALREVARRQLEPEA